MSPSSKPETVGLGALYVGVSHSAASAYDSVARFIAAHPADFIQSDFSGGDMVRRMRGEPLRPRAAEIDCTSWAHLLLKFGVSHSTLSYATAASSKIAHRRDNMKAGCEYMPDEKMRAVIAIAAIGVRAQ